MTLSPGLCPWTPLGTEPPDPQYLLSPRAYHTNKAMYKLLTLYSAQQYVQQQYGDWCTVI